MATPDPKQPPRAPSPEMVEVRLVAPTLTHETPEGIVTRKRGDVFMLDRRVYDRDVVPMGLNPPRSRAFVLLADETKTTAATASKAQATLDRIAGVRESVREQEQSMEQARATARVMEAENAAKLAAALKPMERTGAVRTA